MFLLASNKSMENDVTEMLVRLSEGNKEVVNDIFPLIYSELRKIAGSYLSRERVNHTLQPTALVHDDYIKLVDKDRVNWQNRAHFIGVAATVMRQLLIDNARRHKAEKRGGNQENLPIEESITIVAGEQSMDLIKLDQALKDLAEFDEFKSRLVELRYFGGLTVEETAEVLGVHSITVKRHWRLAKAWLIDALKNS